MIVRGGIVPSRFLFKCALPSCATAIRCNTTTTADAKKGATNILKVDEHKKEKLANFGRYVGQCVPKFVQQVQVSQTASLH
jgi:hypothetical protein